LSDQVRVIFRNNLIPEDERERIRKEVEEGLAREGGAEEEAGGGNGGAEESACGEAEDGAEMVEEEARGRGSQAWLHRLNPH